jgi:hypothetical protein
MRSLVLLFGLVACGQRTDAATLRKAEYWCRYHHGVRVVYQHTVICDDGTIFHVTFNK